MPSLRDALPWPDREPKQWYAVVVPTYMAIAAGLFWWLNGGGDLPQGIVDRHAYWPPEILTAPWKPLLALLTAPWLYFDLPHIIPVGVPLVGLGWWYERYEGPRSTLVQVVVPTVLGVLAATALLAVLQAFTAHPFVVDAWDRGYVGLSTGIYGLAGGMARRSRRPLIVLGIVGFVEVLDGVLWLKSLTPVFHFGALGVGWWVAGWTGSEPAVGDQ